MGRKKMVGFIMAVGEGGVNAPDSNRCGKVLTNVTSYFRLVYFSYVHCADVTCQQQQQVNNPLWSLCMWITLYTDTVILINSLQNQQLRWR